MSCCGGGGRKEGRGGGGGGGTDIESSLAYILDAQGTAIHWSPVQWMAVKYCEVEDSEEVKYSGV